jgi:glyoxylase-like metal-dependent hydrolase (beta-lactamase superfamily II)
MLYQNIIKERFIMTEVKILLEGYTNADRKKAGEEESTRCTTALIRSDDMIIISDPGVLASQQIMIDALAKENLTVADITHVFITHSHMDHYRNIGMFPTAKAIDYWGIWHEDKVDDLPEKINEDISIINTPGHNYDNLTMIIETAEGKTAIVGDLWWSERGPDIDPFASDMAKLKESRSKVLDIADNIIPGHGKIFKTK